MSVPVTTARRWVAADFGGPEALRRTEVGVPHPRDGQVTMDVRACGMNPADAKHIAPGQDRSLLPLTLGFEVSGAVSAVGAGVGLAVGDEVVAQVSGGYTTAFALLTSPHAPGKIALVRD